MSYPVDGLGWSPMSQSAHDWEREYAEQEERERDLAQMDDDRDDPTEQDLKNLLMIYNLIEKWLMESSEEFSLTEEEIKEKIVELCGYREPEYFSSWYVEEKKESICVMLDKKIESSIPEIQKRAKVMYAYFGCDEWEIGLC